MCLSSVDKEFHIVGAAKENERCKNVFVRRLELHRIFCQKSRINFLWVCRLRIDPTSKEETSLKIKSGR